MGYMVGESSGEDEEDEEESEEEEEDGAPKSKYQAEQDKLRKQMSELETKNLSMRDWMLMGEIDGTKRPANSLLELPLEFDHATKLTPVVTQDMTESIEAMIKKRCLDEHWDDPVRKAPATQKARKEQEEVDTEKSKLGLGDLYAKEYERQILGAKDEDKYAVKHAEVEALFAKVCNRLDLLSNFHYTPQVVTDEITVRPNVPAISLEEALPVGVSEAQALAPEEVYRSKKRSDDLKGEGDATSEDRNRLRNSKKRKHKKTMQKRKETMKAQGRAPMDDATRAKTKATIKSGKENAAASKPSGGLSKSSTLFSALQAEAMGAVAGMKTDKGDKGAGKKKGSSSYKL
eukprot:CAMPEP_0206229694 /NCGR_PEP_ID=MMETSP0047_2-20121206/9838_1 /ASSEMBLY_ACC=CAM_ASM_000192 /TAXON_ID=195065 /ORGANISM="Chroomonas mesostigmatica_cf, Strain CCMP1168" /LENGTH=345 /DNA_ID=CAMNT_0053653019 /DNA_START=100 /DNA_END=1137 /DNA_ORIENTATION=-